MSEPQTPNEWQRRVIDERDELQTRLNRLSVFIGAGAAFPILHPAEQARLHLQRSFMRSYLNVLNDRIDHFDRETP